ncbi:hypothetical protein EI42_00907 [Thermosporothrix hazakensis]|uniref:Uncharacterized protein n=1 Tax=Thermosporothrix hazakensis TaxID=644383 RepID=A0A326UEK9_THEHA|nr:hypothetical protein EI42_00907 [Thermosporothrix hazakensis]
MLQVAKSLLLSQEKVKEVRSKRLFHLLRGIDAILILKKRGGRFSLSPCCDHGREPCKRLNDCTLWSTAQHQIYRNPRFQGSPEDMQPGLLAPVRQSTTLAYNYTASSFPGPLLRSVPLFSG